MRICLLNAPPLKKIGIVGQIYPPLGILYLSSYAKKHMDDLEFIAIDGYRDNNFDKIRSEILDFKPDVLAVSFTTQAATGAYKIINIIKDEEPDIFVICGGAHPTILPEEVLRESKTNLVAIGEGEKIFLEVLKSYNACKIENEKANIKGLAYIDNGEFVRNENMPLIANLDEIPFPDRKLLDIYAYPGYHYKQRKRDTSYVSTRGCPYNCIYCSNPVWKVQKPWYRMRSSENVVDEIEHLIKEYGISEFYDQTDEFNGNLKWAKSVCDEIVRRDLDISWKVQMRADNFDDELACKMVASGCWLGFFGVETGNDETSRGVNKNISTKQVMESFGIMKRHGIKAFALLMAFNVWEENGELKFEDKKATMRTLKFAEDLVSQNKVDLISWSLTTPYPGSKLYEIAEKHNLISPELIGKWDNFDSSANFVMKLPGVNDDDWFYVQKRGKMLQAKLLFKSGTFNFRSIPIYLSKAIKLLMKMVSG